VLKDPNCEARYPQPGIIGLAPETGSTRAARTLATPVTALFATLVVATCASAEPYSLRGISLGTSLADLRRIRFPEAPGARILCSHDAEAADIRPTTEYVAPEAEASAGVVVCSAYTFGKVLGAASRVLPAEWIAARLDVGTIEATPFFWFVPQDPTGDVEETGRLYRIAIRSNAAYWAATRGAFIRRYGPATSVGAVTIRQEGKRDLPGDTLTWANAQSTIRLVQRDEVATRLTITFEHSGLKPVARESPPDAPEGGKPLSIDGPTSKIPPVDAR